MSPLTGLKVLGQPVRTEFEATLYEPVVCVVLRGRKETTFGERTFDVSAGDCLLVSHDLPVVSRVVDAPYLALLVDVNLGTLRSLYDELGSAALDKTDARALEQRIPELHYLLSEARKSHRGWVERVFAPFLPKQKGAARNRRVLAFYAATEVTLWKLLRRDFRSSREETEAVLLALVTGLTAAPGKEA